MEKIFFKEFMRHDVVQKTVIFADAFNLNIDGWRPANTPEYPRRLLFFCGGIVVGYIDGQKYPNLSYLKKEMPFTLFTPFGKITGIFSTYLDLFRYRIENRKDSFSKISGLFEVKKFGEDSKNFHIGSTFTLEGLANNRVWVSFNQLGNNYIIEIKKETPKTYEAVRLNLEADKLTIEHFDYPELKDRQYLATISISFINPTNILPITFDFLGKDAYTTEYPIDYNIFEHVPYWKLIGQIDFKNISEEIFVNDSRMLAFIDEVRNDLTLLANGITPISIYDKIASLCFFNSINKFELDFTRAQNVEVALTRNRVLRKMSNSNH